MIRLKYHTRDELLYTDWLTIGPNLVIRAIINTKTYTYQIVEFDMEVVLEGEANNLRRAKDLVRQKFVECGVQFEGEIRK